jgi:hypothetical protein
MIEVKTNGILEAYDISEVGITDGLVAWYPLDGNTRDYTEYRNNGTVTGATIASGMNGDLCYSFNGTDNYYISVPSSSALVLTKALSVSIFFKANKGQAYIISKGDGLAQTTEWVIGLMPTSGYLFFLVKNSSTVYKRYVSTVGFADDIWHHTCLTWGDGTLQCYADGVSIDFTVVKDDEFTDIINSSGSMFIGIESWGGPVGSYKFGGLIQDVRIYNRALSPEEIKILYELKKNLKTHFTISDKIYIPGKFNEVY